MMSWVLRFGCGVLLHIFNYSNYLSIKDGAVKPFSSFAGNCPPSPAVRFTCHGFDGAPSSGPALAFTRRWTPREIARSGYSSVQPATSENLIPP
jgi:hypothetical protein